MPEGFKSTYILGMDGYQIEVTVSDGRYSPTLVWQEKDKWTEYVQRSQRSWDEMNEDRREGLKLSVKQGLQRLHDDVDNWLPDAIDPSSGVYVDVLMKILFTDADEEINKHNVVTSMKLAEAEKESVALLQKIQQNKPQ